MTTNDHDELELYTAGEGPDRFAPCPYRVTRDRDGAVIRECITIGEAGCVANMLCLGQLDEHQARELAFGVILRGGR